MAEEMIVKFLEQAPSIAVMVWLVYSLRQDVKMLIEIIVELKQEVVAQSANEQKSSQ